MPCLDLNPIETRLARLMNWLVLELKTRVHPMVHASIEFARNELLTRGLDDIEARILIDTLALRLDYTPHESTRLLMKARVVSKIIALRVIGNVSGANQLAACEGLADFLPIPETDSADCMEKILLGCV